MRLNLKKALLYFFIISTILTGCGRTREKEKKDEPVKFDLPQIRQRGKLIAITGYNAYSYFIYKGQPMGYEYELLQRLGKYLRLPIEIKIESRIDKMFEMGDIENLKAYDLKQFVRKRTNEKLQELNYTDKRRFFHYDKDAASNLDWFYHLTGGHTHTDFFAIRPTDYSKANEGEDFEDIW